MFRVFDPAQLAHAPVRELHNGAWADHAETPVRAVNMVAALGPLAPARDFGLAPILAVHDAGYVDLLRAAWDRWQAEGREGEAIGYTFPVTGRRDLDLRRIDALLGRYSYDAATPIGAGTWGAAYAAAQTALTALHPLLDRAEHHAFALCRPPGHHAGRDYLGGYCYLNNAAIAAETATVAGRRVAILDVDYHHGNGTQDIFLARSDVFFASIHADPATDYPFYWGHADETGTDAGEGSTLNLPLPHGTGIVEYGQALDRALAAIGGWAPDLLVVSYGADTWENDPISHFALTTDNYRTIARRIADCGWPTLIVMEGGYAAAALGGNVRSFLAGFEAQ